MWLLILQSIWFFLPAGIANMSPVFFKKINFLNYPVDFGLALRGKPLFGKNKTIRGFFFGTLLAIVFTYIQTLLYPYMPSLYFPNYLKTNFVLLGFLLGFGALFGDLIESMFKRQVGIAPGKSWVLFDQLDWVIGALVFVLFYLSLNYLVIIIALVFFGLMHPIMNYLGYLLKIKKNKF
jgi:CDP-2,3-bis-(O-geranylgeranyl)-sn-glycerol synthase